MLQKIRKQIGTAGLMVAILALIAALAGGAYAASGALTGKQKKEVKAIAKSFQGTGPAGTPGTSGTNGKDGASGAAGKNGTNGTNGAPGKSVNLTEIPIGEEFECEELGGAKVEEQGEPDSAVEVCNGEPGVTGGTGGTGPTGTFGGEETLKPGVTEKGAWAFSGSTADTLGVTTAITFPTPLAKSFGATKVHFFTDENFRDFDGSEPGEVGCKGTETKPEAPTENLCVYEGEFGEHLKNATPGAPGSPFGAIVSLGGAGEGASKNGALLEFTITGDGLGVEAGYGFGTWAVTG
jgi:hypothetical protein